MNADLGWTLILAIFYLGIVWHLIRIHNRLVEIRDELKRFSKPVISEPCSMSWGVVSTKEQWMNGGVGKLEGK